MRVLYVLGNKPIPPLGGVELSIYEVARDVARRGATARVVYPAAKESRENVDGVEFLGVRSAIVSNWVRIPSPGSWPALRRSVVWSDVVHIWNPQELFNLFVATTALLEHRPLVLSTPIVSALGSHPRRFIRWIGGIDDRYVRTIMPRAGLVHVQSLNDLEAASKWSSHVRYIPGGVPSYVLAAQPGGGTFRKAHGIPIDDPVLLFLGRCHPLKGPDQLVRAMPEVLRKLPNAIAVIAGPDVNGSRASLRRLGSELGVGGHLRVLGPLSDADRVGALDSASVVVVPSRADFVEGFSLVVSEAWTRGKPVAAYAVGALRGRIRNGENGYLATPNDPAGLAEAICKAASLPPFPRPEDVVGWSDVAGEFLGIYRGLVAERPAIATDVSTAPPVKGGAGGPG